LAGFTARGAELVLAAPALEVTTALAASATHPVIARNRFMDLSFPSR
jgi:hypothetical protein